MNTLSEKLDLLTREAAQRSISLKSNNKHHLKADGSIVTDADPLIETFLREELPKIVPAAIWGEELGYETENEHGLWLVDPIDGTSNYAFGSPLWGISIALLKGDDLLVGSIALPDLGEYYLMARGLGSTCNGQPLAPIPPGPVLGHELCSFGDNTARTYPVEWPGKQRYSGCFVIDAAFVAQQRFRALVGRRERLYDVAASMLLNAELGAEIRYLDGSPMVMDELKKNERISRPWMIFPAESGFRPEI